MGLITAFPISLGSAKAYITEGEYEGDIWMAVLGEGGIMGGYLDGSFSLTHPL